MAVRFEIGERVEALDFHDNWYKASIVEVDNENRTALVHFEGWNKLADLLARDPQANQTRRRFDEVVSFDSNRVRPDTAPPKAKRLLSCVRISSPHWIQA